MYRNDPFQDEPLIDHSMPGLVAPREPLEIKDQHLVAMAHKNGYLMGRNSVLERENDRLNSEARELRGELKEVREELAEAKRRDSMAQAGYKSGQRLVDEIEEALKNKKASK